jgi:putative endonuclease
MTDRQKTGEIGESLARRWLETSGYEVLEQGYRYKRVELDLVVKTENDCLVFVEVKPVGD